MSGCLGTRAAVGERGDHEETLSSPQTSPVLYHGLLTMTFVVESIDSREVRVPLLSAASQCLSTFCGMLLLVRGVIRKGRVLLEKTAEIKLRRFSS